MMTPIEMEIANRKYSNACAIVVKLSDGSFALFNNQRKFIGATTSPEELMLGIACIESTCEAFVRPTAMADRLSLEDLGL